MRKIPRSALLPIMMMIAGCAGPEFVSLGVVGHRDARAPAPASDPGAAASVDVASGAALAVEPSVLFRAKQPLSDCAPELKGVVGETPLRRLTSYEYANSVRDVLGIDFEQVRRRLGMTRIW